MAVTVLEIPSSMGRTAGPAAHPRRPVSKADLPIDDELIPRLLAREGRAFEIILDAWSPSLLRLARVYVRSDALAEEVVQESWQAVVTGLARFERRSSLKTWVFTMLANRARTRAVREARTVPMSALGSGSDGSTLDPERFASGGGWLQRPTSWEVHSPESLLLAIEGARVIEETLAAIPPMQRAAVVLRDIEGVSSAEACNLLDISESNQRVLLHRGRSRLRSALSKHLTGEEADSES
jgi:RNA polymerase sigma-70 factor, ECF subfamily